MRAERRPSCVSKSTTKHAARPARHIKTSYWHFWLELRALAAATNSEVDVPVRQAADDAPATPPAQLVMGGPLPRQPARAPSNPELVVGADPEMEHPPAVTPDAN